MQVEVNPLKHIDLWGLKPYNASAVPVTSLALLFDRSSSTMTATKTVVYTNEDDVEITEVTASSYTATNRVIDYAQPQPFHGYNYYPEEFPNGQNYGLGSVGTDTSDERIGPYIQTTASREVKTYIKMLKGNG